MSNKLFFIGIASVLAGIILYVCFFGFMAAEKHGYNKGYKDACIDFYKGHPKMDLRLNSDGTKEWVWLKK